MVEFIAKLTLHNDILDDSSEEDDPLYSPISYQKVILIHLLTRRSDNPVVRPGKKWPKRAKTGKTSLLTNRPLIGQTLAHLMTYFVHLAK